MITFKLSLILKELHISQNEFSRLTQVRPNTINNIVNNNIHRLELDTLNKIMIQLYSKGYTLTDFMEFKEIK